MRIFVTLALACSLSAQTKNYNVNAVFLGSVDTTSATSTKPARVVTSDQSGACAVLNEIVINSNNGNLFGCILLTWTQLGGTSTLSFSSPLSLGGSTVSCPTCATTSVATLSSLSSIGVITTGVWQGTAVGLAFGGTSANLSATGPGFLKQATTGAAVTVATLAAGDIPDLSATYQPVDADLTAIAGLSGVRGDVITRGASAWQRLALGASTRVLKSDGTDAVWGQVAYSELTGTPSLFTLTADNNIGAHYIDATGISTPGTNPTAGDFRLYAKTGTGFCQKDSAGSEVCFGATGTTGFANLTNGTNTAAAMLVGTGASLGTTGNGTITANRLASGAFESSKVCSFSGSSPFTCTLTPAPGEYTDKIFFLRNTSTAVSAAATVDINTLGVKAIKTPYGTDPTVGCSLPVGIAVPVVYDGTDLRMLACVNWFNLQVDGSGAFIIDRTVNPPTIGPDTSVVPRFNQAWTQNGAVDFSGSSSTQTIKSGTTDPTTCTAGKGLFINTTSTPVLKLCTATDTWTALGSGGTNYQTVQDEGTGLTQRATLNFVGAGVACVDNTTKTECTIPGYSETASTSGFVIESFPLYLNGTQFAPTQHRVYCWPFQLDSPKTVTQGGTWDVLGMTSGNAIVIGIYTGDGATRLVQGVNTTTTGNTVVISLASSTTLNARTPYKQCIATNDTGLRWNKIGAGQLEESMYNAPATVFHHCGATDVASGSGASYTLPTTCTSATAINSGGFPWFALFP